MEDPRSIRKKRHKGNNQSCLTDLFCKYRLQARKRDLIFEITKGQFRDLTKESCWYCGQKPAQIQRGGKKEPRDAYYIYNGIDRVDNAVGYTEANCIPCCGKCNMMKSTLHAEDFIIHIRKLAHNLGIL